MGIVNSIPNEWKIAVKQLSQQHIFPLANDTFQINIESTEVNALKVTSKMLHNELKHKKQTVPSAQKKTPKISRSFSGMERNLLSSVYCYTRYNY